MFKNIVDWAKFIIIVLIVAALLGVIAGVVGGKGLGLFVGLGTIIIAFLVKYFN